MAVNVSYPGVYVQEIPSAVHTVVGVPTSVAAFVGAAERGPLDLAVEIDSWAAYVRTFGALRDDFPLSWAVYLFFVNGGAAAQVVRAGEGGVPAEATIDGRTLVASSPGEWGNNLSISTDDDEIDPAVGYNLSVTEEVGGVVVARERWQLSKDDAVAAATLGRSALVRIKVESVDDDGEAVDDGKAKEGVVAKDEPKPKADQEKPDAGQDKADKADKAEKADKEDGADKADEEAVVASASPFTLGADPAVTDWDYVGGDTAAGAGRGIFALTKVDIVNMLCLPVAPDSTWSKENLVPAVQFCADHRVVLIVDPPSEWTGGDLTYETIQTSPPVDRGGAVPSYAAMYYPNLVVTGKSGAELEVGPCGAVAGVWAATDTARGVWKAPAGTAAGVAGVKRFSAFVDDAKSGMLNRQAINALRDKPLYGPVVWGARTAAGADDNPNEWKYLPVRRTALYIEESLRRATQWVVFEPNDEPLWSSLRLNVGVFMHSTWRAGAFQGTTPAEAYFVKCDKDVNPQDQIDLGIVNIYVGFAPLKPAEFVVINIQQLAGQLAV